MKSTTLRAGAVAFLLLAALPLAAQDTWIALDTGTTQDLYGVHFVSADVGYVAGAAGTVLKTTDGGTTWEDVSPGVGDDLYDVYFFDANTGVVVGGQGTIRRTTDGGATWTPVSSGTFDTLFSVSFAGGVGLAGGGSQTILRSTDQGATWTEVQGGFFGGGFYGVHMLDASNGFVAGENSIFQPLFGASDDGGASFDFTAFYLNGNEGELADVHFLDALEGVAVSAVWDGQGAVSRTTDGGQSWSTTLFPDALHGVDFASAETGYAVGAGGAMLKTTDGGLTWAPEQSGTAATLNAVAFPTATVGYAAGTGGTVLKGALAGGAPLTLAVTPLDPPVEVPPGGSFRFTVQASNTGDEPVTFDLWAEATHGGTGLSVTRGPRTLTLPAGASRQFTVTQRVPLRAPTGTYTYTVHAGDFPDGSSASDGFPVTVLGTLVADRAAASDWDLIFDAPEASVGADARPARYALEQNAPNPFRAASVIRYALPEGAHVTLRVYDVLGQEVAVLVDGYREAGRHAVTFDASALSAGTYLYRLEAGTFTTTRTMHLVK